MFYLFKHCSPSLLLLLCSWLVPHSSCSFSVPSQLTFLCPCRRRRAGRRSWRCREWRRSGSWRCGSKRWRRRSRFCRPASRLCRPTTTSQTRGWPPSRVHAHTHTHTELLLLLFTPTFSAYKSIHTPRQSSHCFLKLYWILPDFVQVVEGKSCRSFKFLLIKMWDVYKDVYDLV